jgi:signal transduction histidine kinase
LDLNNIIEVFFSINNPVIYAIITASFLLIIIILINQKYLIPLKLKKKELELENANLMALFAETDPNPIVRIDYSGIILSVNNASNIAFGRLIEKHKNILHLFEEFIDLNDLLKKKQFEKCILNKIYLIHIRKVESLKFVHFYFTDISKRIDYENKLKQSKNALRKLKLKIDKESEAEKNKIGQELHDIIGYHIAIIKNDLKSNLASTGYDLRFNSTYSKFDLLEDDIKNISYQLKPRVLNEFGIIYALNSMIDTINSTTNIIGSFDYNDSNPLNSNKELELNVYRICQEAINNIVKHSKCTEFSIQLKKENSLTKLVITDNGQGFDVSEYLSEGTSSLGLLNIKERTESNNGNFKIDSSNEGTMILISFFHEEIQND